MDELEDLKSLQFEYGISEEDRCWLYLLGRSRGLMIEAFAHAIFFCKLFCKLRELIYDYLRTKSLSTESPDLTTAGDEKLKVGIIGGGHLGKKLTWALLQLVPIPPESMRISTRRPETLVSEGLCAFMGSQHWRKCTAGEEREEELLTAWQTGSQMREHGWSCHTPFRVLSQHTALWHQATSSRFGLKVGYNELQTVIAGTAAVGPAALVRGEGATAQITEPTQDRLLALVRLDSNKQEKHPSLRRKCESLAQLEVESASCVAQLGKGHPPIGEFQKLHIPCFYNNPNLVKWADVVFLCCLPSQLPNICVEIQTSLKETSCTVYSFVAAVTLPRLKLLLNYSNILRPQYHCTMDFDNIWGANKDITDALQDPAILRATCPYSSAGGITLDTKWLEGVLYAAINVFTVNKVAHLQTLQLLNKFLVSMHSEDRKKDRASCLQLQLTDFVSAACARSMLPNKSFPWFDLTAVQVQETPFSRHLSTSTVLQEYLTHVYCDSFCISVTEEQPEVHTESPSQ